MNKLEDRKSQLLNEVRQFFTFCYNPEKWGWKKLDSSLRYIEEHIAGIIIYDLKGETDGMAAQFNNAGTPLYGEQLIDRARKVMIDLNVSNPYLLDDIKTDIGNHNLNSHAAEATDADREITAKTNVPQTLQVVVRTLAIDSQSVAEFTHNTLLYFKTIGTYLDKAGKLLDETDRSKTDAGLVNDVLQASVNSNIMPPVSDYFYVLLVPADPKDELVDALWPLFNMRWGMVIDGGHEAGSLYQKWNSYTPQTVHNASLQATLSDSQTNWVFLNGRIAGTPAKTVRRLKDQLARKKLKARNVFVINLMPDARETFRALDLLWSSIAAEEGRESAEFTTIISVRECTNKLDEYLTDNDYQINGSIAEFGDSVQFVNAAIRDRVFPSPEVCRSKEYVKGDTPLYEAAGIRFLDSSSQNAGILLRDNFYTGNLITIEELKKDRDVKPRGKSRSYIKFCNAIEESLKDLDTRDFTIIQQPGSGGTTMARRLAYDIENRNSAPRVIAVFISDYSASATAEMLIKLSKAVGELNRLLVVCDDKEISDADFSQLHRKLTSGGVNPVFLRIRHVLQVPKSPTTDSLPLSSKLYDDDETERFNDKFRSAFASQLSNDAICDTLAEIAEIASSERGNPELIYYPYAFCEKIGRERGVLGVTMKSASYVKRWFDAIKSPELRDFCGYCAFVNHFTASKGLDAYSVSKLWRTQERPSFSQYDKKDLEAMHHILRISEEEGSEPGSGNIWTPRYSLFSTDILDAWRKEWSNSSSLIARNFIENISLELDEKENQLLMNLFILRSGYVNEWQGEFADSGIDNKISRLVGNVVHSEDIFRAIDVFEALNEKYPDNGFFLIHHARLLFEYCHWKKRGVDDVMFEKARKLIDRAFEAEAELDEFHHIAGMLWSRKTSALLRELDILTDKNEVEECEFNILDSLGHAVEQFEICNDLNRGLNPYGYVSMAEIIIKVIKGLKAKRGSNVFLDEEPYIGYVDKADTAISYLRSERFESEDTAARCKDLMIRYLEILGDGETALKHANDAYLTADGESRLCFGRRIVTLIFHSSNHDSRQSLFSRYSNLSSTELSQMKTVLADLRNRGDLDAAEKLFQLHRYTAHEPFEKGLTYDSLLTWYTMAHDGNDKMHIMRSALFMYAICAARLVYASQYDSELIAKCESLISECRESAKDPDIRSYRPRLFLESNNRGKWDSLMDAADAESYDSRAKRREYDRSCARFDAKITEISGPQGYCEINCLSRISFANKGMTIDAVGRTMLAGGVLGFKYYGCGVYGYMPKSVEQTNNLASDVSDDTARQMRERPDTQLDLQSPTNDSIQARRKQTGNKTDTLTEQASVTSTEMASEQSCEKEINKESEISTEKGIKKAKEESAVYKTETERSMPSGPKIIAKIDLSKFEPKRKRR